MLLVRAFVGFLFLFLIIASVLFGFSETLHDAHAWTTVAIFFGFSG
jgi:hypothetical protein